ncbi:MAG: MATE family efflux transporter [bacterium]|nr:MATE family efflux transporter [bacterium]
MTSVGAMGLFQMVDLYFLGQLGPEALAAAGATNQTLRQIIFLLILGLMTATQMFVARSVGEGKVDRAEHFAGQTLLLGILIWLIVTSLGLFAGRALVSLIAVDPEVIELGTAYVRIAFPFLATAIFAQLGAAVLGGAGDTTTPMIASFVQTPLALLGEWCFGFGHLGAPALGIVGIALGTGLGGIAGSLVLLSALFRGRSRVHLRLHHLRPDPGTIAILLQSSWQPALHMLARSTLVVFFMFLAGRLGGEVQAAYTIGLRIEMVPIMIAFPIANACATMVGQNLGAGSLDRAWHAIRISFAVELAAMWPIALAIFLLRHTLVSFFTKDPEVARIAAEFLVYSSIVLSFYGLYFASFRALQAAGDMRTPMLISISVAGGLAIPLALFLTQSAGYGATGMWIASLAYGLVNALLMIAWLATGRWARPHAKTSTTLPS